MGKRIIIRQIPDKKIIKRLESLNNHFSHLQVSEESKSVDLTRHSVETKKDTSEKVLDVPSTSYDLSES